MYAAFDAAGARIVHFLRQGQRTLTTITPDMRRCALVKKPFHDVRTFLLYGYVQQRLALGKALMKIRSRNLVYNFLHWFFDRIFILDLGTKKTHQNVPTAACVRFSCRHIDLKVSPGKLQRRSAATVFERENKRFEGGADKQQIYRSQAVLLNSYVQRKLVRKCRVLDRCSVPIWGCVSKESTQWSQVVVHGCIIDGSHNRAGRHLRLHCCVA
jgi:hypothetical protein